MCVGNLNIIGSDNGLSPGRRQAIIWTNAGILLIRTLGTNFSEILSKIATFSFKKMHLKMSSAKWRPFCLGLNVLRFKMSPQLMIIAMILDKFVTNLNTITCNWKRYKWKGTAKIPFSLLVQKWSGRTIGHYALTSPCSHFALPDQQQQQWYWQGKIGISLSFLRASLNKL